MVNWKTELTSYGETLGLVDGVSFRGTACPILSFAFCMVPMMTKILRDTKEGYTLGTVKINHLFSMDDLKIYGKNKAEIESLVSIVQLISYRYRNEIWDKEMWFCGVEEG